MGKEKHQQPHGNLYLVDTEAAKRLVSRVLRRNKEILEALKTSEFTFEHQKHRYLVRAADAKAMTAVVDVCALLFKSAESLWPAVSPTKEGSRPPRGRAKTCAWFWIPGRRKSAKSKAIMKSWPTAGQKTKGGLPYIRFSNCHGEDYRLAFTALLIGVYLPIVRDLVKSSWGQKKRGRGRPLSRKAPSLISRPIRTPRERLQAMRERREVERAKIDLTMDQFQQVMNALREGLIHKELAQHLLSGK